MARIFISHSSLDEGAAIAVRDWLINEGWDDLFLDLDAERGLVTGQRWQDALKTAAERCELVLFLITPNWVDSKWCQAEFLLAKSLNKQIFGIIVSPTSLEDLPIEMTSEWHLVDLTSGELDKAVAVDLVSAPKTVDVRFNSDGLQRLKIGLLRSGLDAKFFAWPPENDPDRPPYRGLRALEEEDAGIFFGRDGQIVEALDRLRGLRDNAPPRLLAVLGASGSGKSSFMRAGLLPRLTRDDRHFLVLPVIRPQGAVISGETGLLACLEAGFKSYGLKPTKARIRSAINAGGAEVSALLGELVQKAHDGLLDGANPPSVILPIDQAEELYVSEGADEASVFSQLLSELLSGDNPAVIAVLTIRTDAYEHLQFDVALGPLRQQTLSLPPMPYGSYEEVIKGPARRLEGTGRALKIEDQLIEALLRDIEEGGAKDALPLLAFTLERLYLEYGGDGNLKLDEYEELGRIKGSIEAAVEGALKRADGDPKVPKERESRLALLRRGLVPWLAGVDPETGGFRRKIAKLSQIPEEARPLMLHLVEQRLLATDVSKPEDGKPGETTIEPAHEALLRQWGLLQGWLKEDFEALSALEGVQRASMEWEANDHSPQWLAHTAGRLESAEKYASREDFRDHLTPSDREYLSYAREHENQRRDKERKQLEAMVAAQKAAAENAQSATRRTRMGLFVALMLTVVAGGFAWYGLQQAQIADNEKLIAENQRSLAQDQTKKAKKAAAEATIQRGIAERNSIVAQEQKKIAEHQVGVARRQQLEAIRQEAIRINLLSAEPRANKRMDIVNEMSSEFIARITGNAPVDTAVENLLRQGIGSVNLPISRMVTGNAFSLAVSPDAKLLAVGIAGGQESRGYVHIFDSVSLQEQHRFRAVTDTVMGLAFSPDNRSLAVAGGKVATVWDTQSGQKRFDLVRPKMTGLSKSVRYTADGDQIIVSTSENRVVIYNSRSGEIEHTIAGSTFDEANKRYKPSFVFADSIIESHSRRTWSIWGSATEFALGIFQNKIAVSGSGAVDGSILLYNLNSGNVESILTGGPWAGLAGVLGLGKKTMQFTPDGSRLVAFPTGRNLGIWSLEDGQFERALSEVSSFFVSDDSKVIVTGGSNGKIVFHCINSPDHSYEFQTHDSDINRVVPSPDGQYFLSTSSSSESRSSSGVAKLWRLPKTEKVCPEGKDPSISDPLSVFKPKQIITGHWSRIQDVVFLDSERFVTASQSGIIRIWKVNPSGPSGDIVLKLSAERPRENQRFAFNSGYRPGEFFQDQEMKLFNDSTMILIPPHSFGEIDHPFYSAYLVTDGKRVSLSGEIVAIARRSEDSASILFSNDNRRWVVGDTFTTAPQVTPFEVSGALISPDGERVIMSKKDDDDTEIYKLINANSGKQLSLLTLGKYKTGSFSFSRDGSRIIGKMKIEEYSLENQKIAIWDATDGTLITQSDTDELNGMDTIRISKNGKTILGTAFWGTDVLLSESGGNLRKIAINEEQFGAIGQTSVTAMSNDGRYVAYIVAEKNIAIYDIVQRNNIATFNTPAEKITLIEFSDDGKFIAIAGEKGSIHLFDWQSGKAIKKFSLEKEAVLISFDGNLNRVITCHSGGKCHIFDANLDNQALLVSIDVAAGTRSERKNFAGVDFSEDGQALFTKQGDRYRVIDVQSGREVFQKEVITNIVTRAANGKTILYSATNRSWTMGEIPPTDIASGLQYFWASFDISSDGSRGLLNSGDFELWKNPTSKAESVEDLNTNEINDSQQALVDMHSHEIVAEMKVGDVIAFDPFFTPDGTRVIAKLSDGEYDSPYSLGIWDSSSGALIAVSEPFDQSFEVISDDGNKILVGSVIFELSGNKFIPGRNTKFAQKMKEARSTSISPNGQIAVLRSKSNLLTFVDVETNTDISKFQLGDLADYEIFQIRFSQEGGYIALHDSENRIRIINTASGELLAIYQIPADIEALEFDAESKRIAVCHSGNKCLIVPVKQWEITAKIDNVADWFRAIRPGNLSKEIRSKYGILTIPEEERPDLSVIHTQQTAKATKDLPMLAKLASVRPLGQISASEIQEILSGVANIGYPNLAEAAMKLSGAIADQGKVEDGQHTLFYSLLGRELDEKAKDIADVAYRLRLENIGRIRELATTTPPEVVVSVYRRARDWRAVKK